MAWSRINTGEKRVPGGQNGFPAGGAGASYLGNGVERKVSKFQGFKVSK